MTIQAQILELIQRLQHDFGIAVILITHDLGVVAGIADEVLVMYAGKAMEYAPRRDLYYRPHHPYTAGCSSRCRGPGTPAERLRPIPGHPPSLINPPDGCPFHPRCRHVMARCLTDEPPLRRVAGDLAHRSSCWLPVDLVGLGVEAARGAFAAAHRPSESNLPSDRRAAS